MRISGAPGCRWLKCRGPDVPRGCILLLGAIREAPGASLAPTSSQPRSPAQGTQPGVRTELQPSQRVPSSSTAALPARSILVPCESGASAALSSQGSGPFVGWKSQIPRRLMPSSPGALPSSGPLAGPSGAGRAMGSLWSPLPVFHISVHPSQGARSLRSARSPYQVLPETKLPWTSDRQKNQTEHLWLRRVGGQKISLRSLSTKGRGQ